MWLSRLIVTAGLLLLSACSGFEIKSLATHSVSTRLNVSSSSSLSVQGSTSDLKKKTMTASIVLVDLATGEVVLSDSLSANATLGTVSAQFAQTRSDRHADERLAMLLADRVAARLHLFFSQTGS